MPIVSGGGGGAGAVTLITSSVLGIAAASFDITGISQSSTHLWLVLLMRGDTAAATTQANLRLNNDSGADYDRESLAGVASATSQAPLSAGTSAFIATIPAGTSTAAGFCPCEVRIPFYTATTANKAWNACDSSFPTLGTTASYAVEIVAGLWRSTAAVSRITVTPAAGNFAAGSSFALYGIT